MKKLLLFFISLFLLVNLSAQNSAYSKTIHEDYGTWMVRNGDNIVSISAFSTVEVVDSEYHRDLGIKYREIKQEKAVKISPQTYHYELYLVSKSVYEGDTTNTWLYGTKIFINDEYVLENQFPDGFVISIKTTPTLIHTHHSKNLDVRFEVTWEKSVYEPRIRK